MVRLFIAVQLPDEVKRELVRIQKNLIKQHILIGNYPQPQAMHLTLKFLGDIPQETILCIQQELQAIIFSSMQATLTLLMLFGSLRFPKVVYVDVDCPPLQELVHIFDDRLTKVCPPELREFKPHLTIARVKQVLDLQAFEQWMQQTQVNPVSFTIDQFDLMQSELTSSGPVHTLIERYNLKSSRLT